MRQIHQTRGWSEEDEEPGWRKGLGRVGEGPVGQKGEWRKMLKEHPALMPVSSCMGQDDVTFWWTFLGIPPGKGPGDQVDMMLKWWCREQVWVCEISRVKALISLFLKKSPVSRCITGCYSLCWTHDSYLSSMSYSNLLWLIGIVLLSEITVFFSPFSKMEMTDLL